MRTVQHNYEPEGYQALVERTDHVEVLKALGHLSTWGAAHYPAVTIFALSRDNDEMVACYYMDGASAPSFTMGAVWRPDEKRFTFHS